MAADDSPSPAPVGEGWGEGGMEQQQIVQKQICAPCAPGQNKKIAFPAANRQMKGMAKTKVAKRTPNAAFMKPVTPDEKLAKVVGDKPLPRTELTKKLWAYIRKNGLQDAKKRTLVNADENLKAVFDGKKQVSMFEMTKLVSGHVKK
jgi:chromatin remodeling complex protein RSC6